MKLPYISLPVRFSILVIFAVLVADAALSAEFERSFSFDSKEMTVSSLIGEVQVVEGQSDQFKITVQVRGEDADEDLLEFSTEEGSSGQLAVVFPIDKHRRYVYPHLGKGNKSVMHYRGQGEKGNSWLKKVFNGLSGKKITVRGSGNGLEIWADLTIEVPRGRVLHMNQGLGSIEARDVAADLDLDTRSGPISGWNIEGDFSADTGSGHVTAQDIIGEVFVDTGSGHVTVENVDGPKLTVDTGSGGVKADRIRCDSLNIDTGSGQVRAMAVETDAAIIDTGSGSVVLQLDRMGSGKYHIDTGSGSITLDLPDQPSAHITADTGSGRVSHDLQQARIKVQERDELVLTVGEGEARIVLDAGSGSIKIK